MDKVKPLIKRYGGKLSSAVFGSRKIKYDFRSPAEKAAAADPKSPTYKKNLVDRFVDRVLSPY